MALILRDVDMRLLIIKKYIVPDYSYMNLKFEASMYFKKKVMF